tara:strand:+ start:270 stop:524 length:255 start_codon:yes stop_codon:yes gene_type:complete
VLEARREERGEKRGERREGGREEERRERGSVVREDVYMSRWHCFLHLHLLLLLPTPCRRAASLAHLDAVLCQPQCCQESDAHRR